ncbi:MAG: hypothetical protein R3250_11680, partial [Melioribacteraceae bacterium]|nr:hypothetical protein [Melioribacteraceae bacterium]
MKKNILLLVILLSTNVFPQDIYQVNKNGTANFSSIAEVNSANLMDGDIVSFQSGQTFSDAVLNCKRGVTYNTYGGSEKAILGVSSSSNLNKSIIIAKDYVTLNNLKIVGYKNARTIIELAANYATISDCEILGGENAHEIGTIGIKQSNKDKGRGHKILRNTIHDMGFGIYIERPYNYEIGFNEMYNFYLLNGSMNYGGTAMRGETMGESDTWDADYTFHVHHNEIYFWEYTAMAVGFSNMLIEYNEFHSNLDERIYRGGVKHGTLGKMYDIGPSSDALGGTGLVFRYNYVHNIKRYGRSGHTYGRQTESNVKDKKFNTLSTNNGLETSVYEYSVNETYVGNLINYYGNHFGDQKNDMTGESNGEGPDDLISGQGYANYWIHNNIFANIDFKLFGRVAKSKKVMRDDLGSFVINNTFLNCGNSYLANATLF